MDDSGLFTIMIELAQPLAALIGGAMLLVAKVILDRIKALGDNIKEIKEHFIEIDKRLTDVDHKIEVIRNDFREDIKELQRREACAQHREYLNRRIDELRKSLLTGRIDDDIDSAKYREYHNRHVDEMQKE